MFGFGNHVLDGLGAIGLSILLLKDVIFAVDGERIKTPKLVMYNYISPCIDFFTVQSLQIYNVNSLAQIPHASLLQKNKRTRQIRRKQL